MNLKKIAESLGKTFRYDKYRCWHRVPFIGNTAIVIDETVERGGQRLIYPNTDRFPVVLDENYIAKAVNAESISLGSYVVTKKSANFIPFERRTGIPSGYYTHKIGQDVQ